MKFKVGKIYKDLRSKYYIFICDSKVTYDAITEEDRIVYSFYYLDLPDEVENMWEYDGLHDWVEV